MEELPHKNLLKNPEYIIAFSVALISICALVVSIRQTSIMSEQRALMHQQAKASVWPRLSLGIGKSHGREDNSLLDYQISVNNAGVGPAIVKNVQVRFKGEPVNSWWALFKKFDMSDSIQTYITNSSLNQSIIRQGNTLRILSLKSNLPLAQEFYKNSKDISIDIYYESIYGDQWKYSTGLTTPDETMPVEPPIEEFAAEISFEN